MGTGRGPFLGTPKRTDTVWVAAAVVRYVADAGRAKVTSWRPAEGCIWGTPGRTDIVWGARRRALRGGRGPRQGQAAGGRRRARALRGRLGQQGRRGAARRARRAHGPRALLQARARAALLCSDTPSDQQVACRLLRSVPAELPFFLVCR